VQLGRLIPPAPSTAELNATATIDLSHVMYGLGLEIAHVEQTNFLNKECLKKNTHDFNTNFIVKHLK